jgi:molecular chaperone IbpA
MDMNQYKELSIGMDTLFSRLFETSNTQAFPPYNIYRIGDNNFKIELALAGYLKKDIEITLKDGVLSVISLNSPSNLYETACFEGRHHKLEHDESVYEVHRGITGKQFKRSFQLAENIKVNKAVFTEGILTIDLEQLVPEEKQLKVIDIK